MHGNEDLTEVAQNVAGPAGAAAIGGVVGLIVALILIIGVRKAAKTSDLQKALLRQTWLPTVASLMLLGVWFGFTLTKPSPVTDWFTHTQHILLLLVIATGSWLLYAALGLLSDPAVLLDVSTGRDIRRFKTQAQILRRVAQVAVVLIGLVLALLTFPSTRAPMTSILASAGVLSVVAGLAAQSSLGNMFAGLQLAFTDALRVGDTVMIATEDQPSVVEEITLTYVVLQTWDERRILLPSTYFTTEPFENWTRRATKQLAWTMMELDWSAPIAEIRAEIGRLVENNHLWDGRSWSVQVVAVNAPYLELKVVVSAASWADAWDLRSYVRENMVAWINEHAPWAIPAKRLIESEKRYQKPGLKVEEIDDKYIVDAQFSGKVGGGARPGRPLTFLDPDKAEVADLKADTHKDQDAEGEPQKQGPKWPGKLLFGGSEDGKRRAKMFSGPGKHVMALRAKRAEHLNSQATDKPETETGASGNTNQPT